MGHLARQGFEAIAKLLARQWGLTAADARIVACARRVGEEINRKASRARVERYLDGAQAEITGQPVTPENNRDLVRKCELIVETVNLR